MTKFAGDTGNPRGDGQNGRDEEMDFAVAAPCQRGAGESGESERGSGGRGVFEERGWHLLPGVAKRADLARGIGQGATQDLQRDESVLVPRRAGRGRRWITKPG